MCILNELFNNLTKYTEKEAIIYREETECDVVWTYAVVEKAYLQLCCFLDKYNVKNGYVALKMEHNLLIPSLVLSLHKQNCAFMFLKTDYEDCDILKRAFISFILVLKDENSYKFFYKDFTYIDSFIFGNLECLLYTKSDVITPKSDICYIVCTSGTVSIEKTIVFVENNGIWSNILSLGKIFLLSSNDIIYFGTPLTFDPSIIELFLALYTGASLLITPCILRSNSQKLYKLLFSNNKNLNCTFLQMVPSVFLRWSQNEINNILEKLKVLALGGEKFPIQIFQYNQHKKCKIYNLYGITEVSVWASIELIKENDEISIGNCLGNTEFYIDKDTSELFIKSTKRICYLNNEITENNINLPIIRSTGDIVKKVNEKYYYVGRKNFIIKKYGHRINLSALEDLILQNTDLQCVFVYNETNFKLTAYFFIENFEFGVKEKIIDKIRVKLLKILSAESLPDFIDILRKFPLSINGKIDRKSLLELSNNKIELNRHFNLNHKESDLFLNLLHSYLGSVNENLTFFEQGGNSILALQLLSDLENSTNQKNNSTFVNLFFEKSLKECLEYLQKNKSSKRKLNIESSMQAVVKKINCPVDIKLKEIWKYDLKSCVDATALIFEYRSQLLVAVGSFSNIFAILNFENGSEIFKVTLGDSIENSCLFLPKYGCIFVGCRDGKMYCLSIKEKRILWEYKTNDSVKNTAVASKNESNIYFGSYDKHFYCITAKKGQLLWKRNLNASITSNSTIEDNKIFIANLKGVLFCLNSNTGHILFSYETNFPIFSPVLVNHGLVFIGNVNGSVNAIDSTGKLIFNLENLGQIYAKMLLHKNILFVLGGTSIFICKITERDCVLSKTISLGCKATSDLVLFGGDSVLFVDNTGGVFVLNCVDYRLENIYSLNEACFSSTAVYNKKIVVGCRDNNVHCFKLNS